MRRFPRIFLGTFFFCLVAALAGAEVARLKVEQGLGRFLGVPVHVRRLTFSARHLTLRGVSFQLPRSVPLKIDRIRLEGSILSVAAGKFFAGSFQNVRSLTLTGLNLSMAGVPLQAEGRVFVRGKPGSYAQVDGWLKMEHGPVRGSLEVAGPLLEPVLFGWVEGISGGRRNFVAKLDVSREAIGLQQMQIQGGWTATGGLAFRQPSWRGDLDLRGPEHRFRFQIEPAQSGFTRATLWYHPDGGAPKEFSARWIVQGGQVRFDAQLLGKQAMLQGVTDLQFPYRSAVTLEADNLDLKELADWIPGQANLAGKMRGRVQVTGFLGKIISSGEISASAGRFNRLDFDQITVRFDGKGPILRLSNSSLARRGGTMLIDGMADVRRVGRSDFFQLVKLTPLSGARDSLDVGGFQLSPVPDSSGVTLERSGSEQTTTIGVEYSSDPAVAQDPIVHEGLKVQRALTPEQNLKIRVEKEEQIIAVEHRKKF